MPELGVMLLRTRAINDLTGSHYSVEDVQEMDPLIFTAVSALKAGLSSKGP